MAYECPTCDYTTDTKRGVSIHHSMVHDESLVSEESSCKSCGATFTYYPSNKKGVYCGDCSDNSWGNDNLINLRGSENPNWSGGVSRTVGVTCYQCGEKIERRKIDLENRDKFFCSDQCLSEGFSDMFSGDGNPMWKGGFHKKWYNCKKWKKVRKDAKDRDGFQCIRCGSCEMLDVHHIKPVREFEDYMDAHTLENVVTLCRSCHRKVEVGEAEIEDHRSKVGGEVV